jgi:hypothetical protein
MRHQPLRIPADGGVIIFAAVFLRRGGPARRRLVRVVVEGRRPVHPLPGGGLWGSRVVPGPAFQIVFEGQVGVVDFELLLNVGVNVSDMVRGFVILFRIVPMGFAIFRRTAEGGRRATIKGKHI